MALSRIWSAFIIVSICAASFTYFFSPQKKDIFNDMVVGKSGDTVTISSKKLESYSAKFKNHFLTKKDSIIGDIGYKLDQKNLTSPEIKEYRIQKADGILATSKSAVDICIGLIGIMTLFMGFMSIAEKAGGITFLSRMIEPLFSKLFPEVPKGHPAFGHMMLNFSANLLGLDNAATPFGLKAMDSLQSLNPDPNRATNAQIMFLSLHASGLTLVPVSIIALRAGLNSKTPTDIFLPCIIATFAATMAALIIVSIKQKINLLQPTVMAYLGGICILVASMIWGLSRLDREGLESVSKLISNGMILLIFFLIVLGGIYKKINIFDAFIEGAKEGFMVCVKIIPYLVGILIAISLLRTSGVFEVVLDGMRYAVNLFGADTRFVDGLPTALIKPLSGSGARGMMTDAMKTFGPDSFQGRLAAILQGSSDTTFYVIAVYFGAIGVRNTRYTVGTMLLADLVGIISSIILAYWFFG